MKKGIFPITIIALIQACSFTDGKIVTSNKPLPVTVQTIQPKIYDDTLILTGIMAPPSTLDLTFRIPGEVKKIFVKEGQDVVIGQTIAVLDNSLSSVEAKITHITEKKYRDEYYKAQELYSNGSISEAKFKEVEYAYELAKQQNVEAQYNKSYAYLRAPETGQIINLQLNHGEVVTPSTSVGLLSKKGNPRAMFEFTQKELPRLENCHVKVYIPDYNETCAVSSQSIVYADDRPNNKYLLKLEVKTNHKFNLEGIQAKAIITKRTQKKVIRIPTTAILHEQKQPFVFVVKNNIAYRKPITIISTEMTKQVVEGLNEGEQLVIDGATFLADRTPVTIQ